MKCLIGIIVSISLIGMVFYNESYGGNKVSQSTNFFNQGMTYSKEKQWDKAIAEYTKALTLNPGYAEAYLRRGLAYHEKGDIDLSIADYTKAIEIKHTYFSAYYARGLAFIKIKKLNDAISDFTKTLELKPRNPADYDIYCLRACAYLETQQFKEAISDFAKLREIDSEAYAGLYPKLLSDYPQVQFPNPK